MGRLFRKPRWTGLPPAWPGVGLLLGLLCAGCAALDPSAEKHLASLPAAATPEPGDSPSSPPMSGPAATASAVSTGSPAAAPASSRPAAALDPEVKPASATAEETSSVPPPPAGALPIDLPTAIRLAEAENPQIAGARVRISEALAHQTQARAMLLPTLNAGASYDGHAGNLQRSSGEIMNVSRQSVYFGAGSRALAAGPPLIPGVGITGQVAEAVFRPLAAHQRVERTRFDATATANTVLLEVASYYLELQGTLAELEARKITTAEAAEVMAITRAHAEAGAGREADYHRAQTQYELRHAEVHQAEEDIAVAAARLARRLHLDPSVKIEPRGDRLGVYALVDLDSKLEDLIQTALRFRPELGSRTAEIGVAEALYRQERARPLLPTLWLGYSGGGFGGGSNREPPLVGNFAARNDFDVRLWWSLENLGLGNLARQKRRLADMGEAVADRSRAQNQVRKEVASALAEARAARGRIEIARVEMAEAQDGFVHDLARIRGAAGLPIEVLDNLSLLRKARVQFIRAVVASNQAQFRLFVALGSPPPPAEPVRVEQPVELVAGPQRAQLPNEGPAPPAGPGAGNPPPPPPEAGPVAVGAPAEEVGREAPDPPAQVENVRGIAGLPARPESDQALRADVQVLIEAQHAASSALLEFDKAQAELRKAMGPAGAPSNAVEMSDRLEGLAESHRKYVAATLEYEHALWHVLARTGAPPTSAKPEASLSTLEGARRPAEEPASRK